jgi:hypothetical protein
MFRIGCRRETSVYMTAASGEGGCAIVGDDSMNPVRDEVRSERSLGSIIWVAIAVAIFMLSTILVGAAYLL